MQWPWSKPPEPVVEKRQSSYTETLLVSVIFSQHEAKAQPHWRTKYGNVVEIAASHARQDAQQRHVVKPESEHAHKPR